MARKMSAQELREEAKRLMDKARKIEDKNYITIGRKAVDLAKKGKIDGELIDEIEKIFGKIHANS